MLQMSPLMNKCLHCYHELSPQHEGDYHAHCCQAFFGTPNPPVLNYRFSEIEQLAKEVAELSISVPGVQPKLSLGWLKTKLENGHQGRWTIVDALQGNYILKPQNTLYPQMPENEHLSMKLAALFDIDVVPASLIRMASGELCYITKRIDRCPDGTKKHMIDFLQILELEDKYKGTMEMLGKAIGDLTVNTLLDKLRFFELAVFNYIIGNNDMHLRNFSMMQSDIGWILSPAYDLLNVKIILPQDHEDSALLLGGKKKNFNKGYFDRLASVLTLNRKQVQVVYQRLYKRLPDATEMIDRSFLSDDYKLTYKEIITQRAMLFEG
jgi:serine/threonine-protein kinase HipA